MVQQIKYPYLPEGRVISYVPQSNDFMKIARSFARKNSLEKIMPGCSVIVKNNFIIGIGTNGSDYHNHHECRRIALKCKTGEGYELCEGCHPKNHSEAKALALAKLCKGATLGADLYLWGHWWCCRACWKLMIEAGINGIYLLEKSEILFNKEHPDNIVGKQLEL
jgi:deoxycytidylate deaminase